jgi:putative FmdB family regulatory protein
MPTYRYECGGCGRVHEIFHSMSETRRKCPDCGGKLTRLIGGGSGVILKGGGFHNTDYRSDSYRKAEKSDREAAGGGDGAKGEAKKGEAKAEAKKAGDGAKTAPKREGKKKAKE